MKMKYFSLLIVLIILSVSGFAQVINAGIGGNSTNDLLNRIEKDVLNQHPDLTIIMVGTNDMLNSRKMISYEDYSANLNSIVKTLKTEGIEVLLMSSPPVDSAYLFMRHDKSLYKQAPNEIMLAVSQIVAKVAKENNAHFLNLFEKFRALNLPRHNEDLFFRNQRNSGKKDGVHPTSLGYHFIAANAFQFLRENNLLEKGMKIVCFGDSITYGSGLKGGGTVTGENYPSFLYNFLRV